MAAKFFTSLADMTGIFRDKTEERDVVKANTGHETGLEVAPP